MSLNNAEFQKVEERDLLQLIESQVAEGIFIEYKRDIYGRSDDDKRELLKDMSSFANTVGGHIVIGIEESSGLPVELVGVNGDIDIEMQRFENLFRDCIEPRIVGLRMRGIRLKSARSALLVRIPRSWNPPHAVNYRGRRRYWARNSAGVHEASVEELRAMFNVAAGVWERALNFQKERVTLVQRNEGGAEIPRQGLILHIIPFSAFSDGRLDPRKMRPDLLVPLWQMGCTPTYNFDGFLATSGNDQRRGYVQAFRNGILEAAVGGIVEETPHGHALFGEEVEDHLTTGLTRYMEALSRAEVSPPMAVLLAAFRMTGSYVAPSQYDPRRDIVHQRKSDMFFHRLSSRTTQALRTIASACDPYLMPSGMRPDIPAHQATTRTASGCGRPSAQPVFSAACSENRWVFGEDKVSGFGNEARRAADHGLHAAAATKRLTVGTGLRPLAHPTAVTNFPDGWHDNK